MISVFPTIFLGNLFSDLKITKYKKRKEK